MHALCFRLRNQKERDLISTRKLNSNSTDQAIRFDFTSIHFSPKAQSLEIMKVRVKVKNRVDVNLPKTQYKAHLSFLETKYNWKTLAYGASITMLIPTSFSGAICLL